MNLLPGFPDRDISLRDNGALKIHHSPADILAAEVPIVMSNRVNPISESSLYQWNGMLCLLDLTSLPIDRCIKTNLPAVTIVMVDLRNPLNPRTWWKKDTPTLMVGLSPAANSHYRDIIASARVSLIAAIATFTFGLIWGPLFFIASFALFVAACLLKTCQPVRVAKTSEEVVMIKGACAEYLRDVTLQTSKRSI